MKSERKPLRNSDSALCDNAHAPIRRLMPGQMISLRMGLFLD
jgi:hypothetical protein